MTTVYDVPLMQLVELNNLMNDDNLSVNEWLEAFDDNEDQVREELLNIIIDDLMDKYNYDGDYEDFNAMNYFIKGVKSVPTPPNHPTQPQRYDQSDDYLFNKLKRLRKINNPLDDFIRQQLQLKFNRDMHKRDSSFLSQLMQHRKDFTNFHSRPSNNDDESIDELFTPKELNSMTIKSFNEWKALNSKQDELVNDIIERLETTPTEWEIDFESLNHKGKEKLFPLLQEFFAEHIDSLPITNKYILRYKVDGR